ncbi:hypothetical protein P879_04933 [Paragonimus westermani]|uniref:Uncharacterized protein n=1 Tax=Paragonimus westermani TaxID=34504 RepID=A0A8T0DTU1_9TREM|nr:hypothetical protein P879_04933 [Paragonimus westermani]
MSIPGFSRCACCKCAEKACRGEFTSCTTYRIDYRGRETERPFPFYPKDNLTVGAPIDCGTKCECKCTCRLDVTDQARRETDKPPNNSPISVEETKSYFPVQY